VFLDGVFVAEVDTYSKSQEVRVPMFAAAGLADASHTFTIEVTGRQNASAAGALIVVDAFDVPAMAISRLQENGSVRHLLCRLGSGQSDRHVDPRSHHGLDSGRFAQRVERRGRSCRRHPARKRPSPSPGRGSAGSALAEPRAGSLAFPWMASWSPWSICTRPRNNPGGGIRGNGPGRHDHTLTIEGTGQQNAFSQNALIVVDAFDVTTPGTRTRIRIPAIALRPRLDSG